MASVAALCPLALLLCAAASAATPTSEHGWAADLVQHARQLGFEESIDAHLGRSKAGGELDAMAGFYEAERMLTETMNDSVAPCDDFEQYACGMYKVIHNKTQYEMNVFSVMQTRVYTEMADWLEKQHASNAKPPGHAVEQAILDYYYCRHGRGTDPERDMRDIHASLLHYGGWPMVDGDRWRPYHAGPMGLVGSIGGRYNPETLITMGAANDWVNPGTNALNIDAVNIRDPNTGKPLHPDVQQLANATFELALAFAESVNATVDKEQLRRDADAVALLQAEAMNTTWRINDWQPPSENPYRMFDLRYYNPFDVVSALNRWPHINWPYFLIKFAEGNVDLYHAFAHPFIVRQPEYFDWLNTVLETYDERTLTNFLLWKYVLALSERHPSLRHHHDATQRALGYSEPMPVPMDCASVVTQDMNYAAGRIYVDLSDLTRQDMDELNTMIGLTLAAWRGMIKSVGWMSDGSKEQAYAKLSNMARNVAYPSWLMSDNDLNTYYDKLDVRKSDDNLEAAVKFLRFNAWTQFRDVGTKVDRNVQSWWTSPAVANAWYKPTLNSITFTAAIMGTPAFKATYPRAYNFASIGAVMGHELGHGFDDHGIYFNYKGGFVNGTWMDPASQRGFDHMAQCVAAQYDQFCLELHGPGTDCVDGNRTLGENLADNGGMLAAYRAYVAFNTLMGSEPLLPANGSLGGLSHAQIFFQSYAHFWCSDVPDAIALRRLAIDRHSPERFRVIGVVQNSADFAAAWQCKRGDPMAPVDPCVVWHHPKDASAHHH